MTVQDWKGTRSELGLGSEQGETYDAGLAIELRITEQSRGGVVENVEESYHSFSKQRIVEDDVVLPRGFFLRARKTVSKSSRYLK